MTPRRIRGGRLGDAALNFDSCVRLQPRLTIRDNRLARLEALLNNSFSIDGTDRHNHSWFYPLVRPHEIHKRALLSLQNRLGRDDGSAGLCGTGKHDVAVYPRPKTILRVSERRSEVNGSGRRLHRVVHKLAVPPFGRAGILRDRGLEAQGSLAHI